MYSRSLSRGPRTLVTQHLGSSYKKHRAEAPPLGTQWVWGQPTWDPHLKQNQTIHSKNKCTSPPQKRKKNPPHQKKLTTPKNPIIKRWSLSLGLHERAKPDQQGQASKHQQPNPIHPKQDSVLSLLDSTEPLWAPPPFMTSR